MKIGMLVGAVGLALAGAAYADHGVSAPVDSRAGLNAGVGTSAQTNLFDANQFVNARNAAIGAPGTSKFRSTMDQVRRGIANGYINPKTCLFEAGHMGLKAFSDDGQVGDFPAPPSAEGAPRVGNELPSSSFRYFDGFETYVINTVPFTHPIAVAQRLAGQTQPSGFTPTGASSMFSAIALPQGAGPGGTWAYSPAVPLSKNPYSPGMAGGYPVDRDVAVEQACQQGMGTRIGGTGGLGDPGRLTGSFLGYNLRQVTGVLYAPTVAKPIVCSIDMYSGDVEDSQAWSAVSFTEGFILTRIYCGGYDFGGVLAEGDGHVLRPQILGPLANNFTIGQFYAPPVLTGALPTYHTKTNQWFTLAIRMTLNSIAVFARDTGTDGTTFLIDDDPDRQYFETGWAEIFPGKAATLVAGTTWRGYGRAETEFGEQAPSPAPLLAAVTIDGMQSLVGGEPTTVQLPVFHPSNIWQDNFVIIGDPFPTPPVPDLTLPYKDDMERYFGGGPLALQGGRWTDNLSSRAIIATGTNTTTPPGSDGSASPSKSIDQQSIIEDSSMRVEFNTDLPPGRAGQPDLDPLQRAEAIPGTPVSINAQVNISNTTTVRAFGVNDNDADFVGELLLLGASNHNDVITPKYYITLTNPTFNEALMSSSDDRADDVPNLAANGVNINWPTLTTVTGLSFHKVELVLFGDGTAAWKVDGADLTFDSAFYTLDSRLEDALKVAKRIQLGLPPLAAVSGPYTRFSSAMKTCDQVTCWSGNQLGGFGDEIFVDDVKLDAQPRVLVPGPDFTLTYMDDFSKYPLNQSISQQGDTNAVFAPADSNTTSKVANIRSSWLATGSFPGTTDWCSYSIQEIIPQFDRDGNVLADQWGFAVAQTVFVRKPFVGFNCETRASVAGKANLTLVDPAAVSPRRNGLLRVGNPTNVTSTGAAANFRADDDRYLSTSYFCRYQLVTVVADPDVSMGGTPFTLPAGWAPGAIVDVDNLFAANALSGVRPCAGSVSPANSTWRVFTANNNVQAHGTWTLLSTNVPTCGPVTPVGGAVNTGLSNTDIRGYAFNAAAAPRWDDLLNVNFVSSGFDGDGWIRLGNTELDAVKTQAMATNVSIDPASKFGNVLAFRNFGAAGPSGHTEYASGGVNLPTAQAAIAGPGVGAKHAAFYYDIYVQDNNTRIYIAHDGVETDCDGGGGIVGELRFGGPDSIDGVPAANFAKLTSASTQVYADTGVAVPVGKWFRMSFEVNADGTWKAGYNDAGFPGGPGGPIAGGGSGVGDKATQYDQNLPGAHANAHLITTGTSLPGPSMLAINNLRRLTVGQGSDEEGDGVVNLGRVHVESLGPTAIRPVGGGIVDAFSYCFYELQILDASPVVSTQIANIVPQTGSSDSSPADGNPDLRVLSASTSDIIAVRFNNTLNSAGGGPVVTQFSQCPQNGDFDITNAGSAVVTCSGTWQLLGIPDTEGVALPKGGISNAQSPGTIASGGNLKGYNDPNRPTRNILLAKWKVSGIPAIPTTELNSNWWIDNLKLQVNSDPAPPPPCPADFNGDGQVGSSDLAFILGAWTSPAHPFTPADAAQDLNHDNQVGSADLALLLGQWGPCPM